MGELKKITKEMTEYSKEELIELVEQGRCTINKMYADIQQLMSNNIFKRLEFLFKVLEHKESFDATFVQNCAIEIKDLITIPTKDEKIQ